MTRGSIVAAARDEDTKLIASLRRQLAETEARVVALTADRDDLLVVLEAITAKLRLPGGAEAHKILARIEELL